MQDNPQQQPPQEKTTDMAPKTVDQIAQTTNKKGKLFAIIGGAVAVAVLIVAVILAFTLTGSKTDENSNKNNSDQNNSNTTSDKGDDEKIREANSKTAKYSTDFEVVCNVGSVSNAASFSKPYKIATFYKSNDKSSWSSVSLPYDAPYETDYDDYESINVVACLKEKSGTSVKTNTCDFKTGDETVAIDYYATVYDVSLYEAKTGKKIKSIGEVKAPATSCPSFVTYDKSNPRITAAPDKDALDTLLAKFAE